MRKVADYGWGVYLVKGKSLAFFASKSLTLSGVFCNILVCLSVFMSVIAESQEGKILSIW
jgi:formate/nitrite transporter FocA (FNT family)